MAMPGIGKNDASVLVADDHALIERFKNTSHVIEPWILIEGTRPLRPILQFDFFLLPSTDRYLTSLGGWKSVVAGAINVGVLCRPEDPMLFHPGD
jgi:hypothetical protein